MEKTVLIVEDNVTIRELYSEVLRNGGFMVEEAKDGQEAKEKIYEGNWDLLLLDIMLPRLDGLNLLKSICQDEKYNTKPILVISNISEKSLIEDCLSHGVKEYLVKSDIFPDEILKKVNKYIFPNE